MSFRFSILHPTARINRTDPLWWGHSARAYFDACDDPSQVEYVLAVHESNWRAFREQHRELTEGDNSFGAIFSSFAKQDTFVLWGAFRIVVNRGANTGNAQGHVAETAATGEILIGSMDDLFPPQHWDAVILDTFLAESAAGPGGYSIPRVLHVSSGSPGDSRTFIPQIVTRARFEQFGYICHPAYRSMYGDNEFTEVAIRDGVVVEAPHIQFEHRHPWFGTAKQDAVYSDQNSKQAYEQGYQTFLERRAAGFPKVWPVKEVMPSAIGHTTGASVEPPAPEQRGGRPLFSILYPSARPDKIQEVMHAWLSKAKHPEDVEIVLCADERWGFERYAVGLERRQIDYPFDMRQQDVLVWNDHPYKYSGYVSSVNTAAAASHGDILIVIADDQFPCEAWDAELLTAVVSSPLPTCPRCTATDHLHKRLVIEVSTGTVNEHERGIFVMPILSRARYAQLGYVFYPAYESMYADNDLCEQARKDDVVIDARHLMFPHRHPLIPVESGQTKTVDEKAWDKAYRAQHQQGAYELGKFILDRRRANGFTDITCSLCGAAWGGQHLSSCERKGKVEILIAEQTVTTGTRGTILWCLPMSSCSAGWFISAIGLYDHMHALGFSVITANSQGSLAFVIREILRKQATTLSPAPTYLLWQDSDNLISSDVFNLLLADLETYPDLMSVSGWYRLPPGNDAKIRTSVTHLVDGDARDVTEDELLSAPGLFSPYYHGFGCVLMRSEILDKLGVTPFAPIPAPNSPWGATGEDCAFCVRAHDVGCNIAVDPRAFVPHLKLGELGPRPVFKGDPKLSVQTIPKMSVQTMNTRRKSDGILQKQQQDTNSDLYHVRESPYPEVVETEQDKNGANVAKPRIVACLRVKNEGRWIRRVLESLKPLCSHVVILDNHSTDATYSEVLAVKKHWPGVLFLAGSEENSDEGKDRLELLNYARTLHADWIFNVDGDEELDPASVSQIQRGIAEYTGAVAFAVKILYLWDRPDQIRMDGWYREVWLPRLFRVTPNLGFESIKNGIHTRIIGIGDCGALAVNLWHYGYMLKSDRLAKYEFYNRIDPNNEAEDCYRHMVIGDLPDLPATARTRRAGPLELRKIDGPDWKAEDWERIGHQTELWINGAPILRPILPQTRRDLEVALL